MCEIDGGRRALLKSGRMIECKKRSKCYFMLSHFERLKKSTPQPKRFFARFSFSLCAVRRQEPESVMVECKVLCTMKAKYVQGINKIFQHFESLSPRTHTYTHLIPKEANEIANLRNISTRYLNKFHFFPFDFL